MTLPQLMDARMISEETGLKAATVEKIMRQCDIIRFEGVRRSFVRRCDVEALIRVSDYHLAGRALVKAGARGGAFRQAKGV